MAKTKDLGPIFWHTMVYPIKPPVLWERSETQEIDGKYRFGKGIAIRFPFTRLSLVIGRWVAMYDESKALTIAIRGRVMAEDEVDWDYIRAGVAEYEELD